MDVIEKGNSRGFRGLRGLKIRSICVIRGY